MTVPLLKIVAPVSSAEEARLLIQAGADELYCGAMFESWSDVFGDADLLSRRQGRLTHVRSEEELAAIARIAASSGIPVALTLNSRYSSIQEKAILDLAVLWEELGGSAVLVSDLGILQALRAITPALKCHASLLFGVWNSFTATFLSRLGVTRIVLPRDLALPEIQTLIENAPDVEYEALVMNQRCQFIDGMCGFYHAVRIPGDLPAVFDYSVPAGAGGIPSTWSYDPGYEGHGCELSYETERGSVCHVRRDDLSSPYCAACQLDSLSYSGVRFLKIAGRGYPVDITIRCIHFLKKAVELHHSSADAAAARALIGDLYLATFGSSCAGARCYYAEAIPKR